MDERKAITDKNIKAKAVSSAAWKFGERIIAKLVTLVVSIILARILMPEDYSVVAIITIFFNFANIIISGGLNTALIQKKDTDIIDYSSVLNLSLIISFLIYAILFALSPVLASVYNQPGLTVMVRVMALVLPISALKSVLCAYISNSLDFKKFFFSTIGGTLVSAAVGIILALKGAGPWALVAQQMTNTVIDTLILFCVTRIKFKLIIAKDRIVNLFSYGWKILASSFIGVLYTEITPLFVGIKYNSTDLSFYTKGRSFPGLISTTTTETLAAVLFPVLSRYQNDRERLLRYTRLYIRLASFIAFPLMFGFLGVAESFVKIVLTEKWVQCVPYIQVFCIASMFDMINIGNCETIKSMGRSDIYLKIEIIKKTAYFIIIGLFLYFTNTPIALAISFIVCTMVAVVVNSVPNIKLIGYKLKYQLQDIVPNLLSAVIMSILVLFVGRINMNSILVLLLQVIVGIASYVLIGIIIKNPSLKYLYHTLKEILKKKGIGSNE